MMYPHWGDGVMGFTGFWGLFAFLLGLFLALLLLAGIVILIIWLVRKSKEHAAGEPKQSSSVELLEQRYARGELSRDEFMRMKDDLTS